MKKSYGNSDGLERLARAVLTGQFGVALPWSVDGGELGKFLNKAGYLQLEDITSLGKDLEYGVLRSNRSRVRYLAALMPDKGIVDLSHAIHYVIGSRNLTVYDVRELLEGDRKELSIAKIQAVGRLLQIGRSLESTAAEAGVSVDSVYAIDDYLGLHEAYRGKLMTIACEAVREGWTIRTVAGVLGIPRTSANRLMQEARTVLVELGEIDSIKWKCKNPTPYEIHQLQEQEATA